MKKRLAALFAAMALMLTSLGLAAAPALADEPAPGDDGMTTVKIDVDTENGDYGTYTVDDDKIVLLTTSVVYELSGNSKRQVLVANADTLQDPEYFNLCLNDVYLEGGISGENPDSFCLSLKVADNTTNHVGTLSAWGLYIFGSGSLSAEALDAGPTSGGVYSSGGGFLWIQDTEIMIKDAYAQDSCVWRGTAELSGAACVTYISYGDYAPLVVLNVDGSEDAVTIKDNAKLYCLQDNKDAPSDTFVDGLRISRGKLVMKDYAFLQVEARPCTGVPEESSGVALLAGGGIEATDNAQIKASAYGTAIDSNGDLTASGTVDIDAQSKSGFGIAAGGTLDVSDGANVSAAGKLEAIDASGPVGIENAVLSMDSEDASAMAGRSAISVHNTVVSASHAPGFAAFSAAESSPIEISLDSCLVALPEDGEVGADATNSLVIVGNEGTVHGRYELLGDLSLAPGVTVTVPAGASLIVPSGCTLEIQEGAKLVVDEEAALVNDGKLVNDGTVDVSGAIESEGEIECNSHSGGAATCSSQGTCALCHAGYLDPRNHANLVHVEAKAATTTAEGNIEYWFCDACGKYFSDEAAEHEISQASTVVPKVSGESKVVSETTVTKKSAGGKLAATGDSSAVAAAAAAVLGFVFVAGAAVACKRNM